MHKAFIFLLLLGLAALSGCNQSIVEAQLHQGFTSTSSVHQVDGNIWAIRVEAVFGAGGMSEARFPFQLPPNRTIVAMQGKIAYKGSCFAEALWIFHVNGRNYYSDITKLPPNGGAEGTVIYFDIPVETGTGDGELILGNGQVCHVRTDDAIKRTTWEFQGLFQID